MASLSANKIEICLPCHLHFWQQGSKEDISMLGHMLSRHNGELILD